MPVATCRPRRYVLARSARNALHHNGFQRPTLDAPQCLVTLPSDEIETVFHQDAAASYDGLTFSSNGGDAAVNMEHSFDEIAVTPLGAEQQSGRPTGGVVCRAGQLVQRQAEDVGQGRDYRERWGDDPASLDLAERLCGQAGGIGHLRRQSGAARRPQRLAEA